VSGLGHNGAAPMTILAGFLSAAERQHLLAMARDPARIWSAGRQETGYARRAIIAAAGGGVLVLEGAEVPLAPGDAIVFRPDLQRHAVTPVVGERFVWSVGCNY
jgi:hypothetical protein